MRILHVVYSCFPGQYRGGISRIVYELGRAQAENGHKVDIFSTDRNSGVLMNVPLGRPIHEDGVTLRYFQTSIPRWSYSLSLWRNLHQTASNYDAIHSHNTWLALNFQVARAGRRSKTPFFFNPHGALDPVVVNRSPAMRLRKQVYLSLIERRNYNRATGIFVNTEQEKKQVQSLGVTSPMHVVPNGIPRKPMSLYKQRGEAFRKQHGLDSLQPIIAFVGRMVAKKGVHLLLEAFATVRSRYPDAVLVLGGDRTSGGAYVRELDEDIKARELVDAVIWTGFLDESQKIGVLGAATIFSHVSASEGMSMAILEAMSAGLPTVVSPQTYMDEAIADGAVLLSDFDATALAHTLLQALEDNDNLQSIGVSARRFVADHHDWRTIAGQVTEIYGASI